MRNTLVSGRLAVSVRSSASEWWLSSSASWRSVTSVAAK